MSENTIYLDSVNEWIKNVVIGLNFCPFARKPYEAKTVRITCHDHLLEHDDILKLVLEELIRLEEASRENLETTLIVLPKAFPDFNDFNDFLYVLNDVLFHEGLEGIFQIASFHPAYQFADTDTNDVGNYTNRSPYPILHLIREDSIEEALEKHPDPDNIPYQNIAKLNQLTEKQLKQYFSYLYR